MKRLLELLLLSFIVFVFSAIIVGHVMRGGNKFGTAVSDLVTLIADIPLTLRQATSSELPEYLKYTSEEKVNLLDKDLFALHTFQEKDEAVLVNLKTDAIVHTWKLKGERPAPGFRNFAMMLPDKGLLYYVHSHNYMARIDSNSNLIWELEYDGILHHSIALDDENGIWICSRPYYVGAYSDTVYFNSTSAYPLVDESITKVDLNTGEVLYNKSLTEMYLEHGMNPVLTYYTSIELSGDVFHINDIEPVLKTSGSLTKGTLLLSLRAQSSVIHFDPATNKILNIWKEGLHCQHDIDIVDDSIISVFNNNAPGQVNLFFDPKDPNVPALTLSQNRRFLYDGTNVEDCIDDMFEQNEIFTATEGLIERLPSGRVFVEEQNDFNIWVFDDCKLVYKGYFDQSVEKGLKEIPNWTKVYDSI